MNITQLLLCVGQGTISKLIQEASESSLIVCNRRASHVAIWDGEHIVIESHFKTRGVKKKSFIDFLILNNDSEIYAYPYPQVSLIEANVYDRLKVAYGSLDILANKFKVLNSLLPDSQGVICSELVAECDNNNIQKFKNELPDHLIQPVHFQEYFKAKNIEGRQIK